MKSSLLLPHKYKRLGWVLLIPAAIAGIWITMFQPEGKGIPMKVFAIASSELLGDDVYFGFVHTDITFTLIGVLIIIGGLLVVFSAEKREDEFIRSLRLNALLWAFLINYLLLLLCFLFVYGMSFFLVMAFNMFTLLVIFILRFYYLLHIHSKTAKDEE